MAYATIQAAKDYLGITTTTDDSLIGGFISSAQAWIDRHCHRTFEATADTERTFDALYDVIGDSLVLDPGLASITSITNGDLNFIVQFLCCNCYPAAFRRILQSIAGQIGQHLNGTILIGKNRLKIGIQLKVQRDAFGFGLR